MTEWLSIAWTLVKDMARARELRKDLDEKTKELNNTRARVKDLEKGTDSGRIEFAGMYLDENGFMPSITRFLGGIAEQDSSVLLALDFAAFGAISWNKQFCSQVESVRRICKASKTNGAIVKLVLNNETTNRDVIERQFPEEEWDGWHTRSFAKIQDWLSCPVFVGLAGRDDVSARVNLSKVSRNGPLKLTRRSFIDSFLEFNERLIELYHEEGAVLTRRTQFVPLHGWFVRREGESAEGIIGIADVQAVWNEPGFMVAGSVASRLLQFFEEMHGGGSRQSSRRGPWGEQKLLTE